MTNPYGNEPGRRPDGLGVPGAQGPQFVPPTSPYGSPPSAPSYGPPPQAPASGPFGGTPYGGPPPGPQQPYGQNPYGQNPYGAPPNRPPNPYQAPMGFTPPPRTPSRSGALIVVGAIVAVLALLVVGWVVLRPDPGTTTAVQPTPSRPTKAATTSATTAKTGSTTKTATPTTSATGGPSATGPVTECVAGDKITTAKFVATVPTNWFCDGDDGDISLSSATYSGLWVDHEDATFGPDDCAGQLYGYGTVDALPDEPWGGVTAKAYRSVDGDDVYGVRCAVVAGRTWYLIYYPHDAKGEASVRADVTTILKTWVWK